MYCFPYRLGRCAGLLHVNPDPFASSSSLTLGRCRPGAAVPFAKGLDLKTSLTLFRPLLARQGLAPWRLAIS
jgi:hypothetical protein